VFKKRLQELVTREDALRLRGTKWKQGSDEKGLCFEVK
jgi:hypothetical protein